jgi:uncharacterized protein YoxC
MSDEEEETYEVSCTENSVDLESMASSLPCLSDTLTVASDISVNKTGEVSSVDNTADVMFSSKFTNLEGTEYLVEDELCTEGTISQETKHSTLPVTAEVMEKNGCIVPTSSAEKSPQQQHMLQSGRSRTVEESGGDTSACTRQYEGNIAHTVSPQHRSVLHPEMQQVLQLSLCEALQKYGITLDISQLIASQAVIVLEEELKGVLRGKLLDTVLRKVAGLDVEVREKKQPVSQMFQTVNEVSLPAVSEEWRQSVSEIVPVVSVAGEQNREQDTVNQLQSGHTQAIDQQLVDRATQTISTGSVLFLKLLSNS